MRKRLRYLFVGSLLVALSVSARTGGPFGLGAVLGDPTGLSFKYWHQKDHAWSGALAFGFHDHHDHQNLILHVTHQWHDFNLIPETHGSLPGYLGVGGRVYSGQDFALGVRGCGGLSYVPTRSPVDIFLELCVVIDFLGHVGGDADGG